jgi:hypothetical protein
MEEILRIVIILIAFNIGLVAFFLTLRTLFPKRVAKTRNVAELMPGRSFAAGLVNYLFFGTLGFILISVADRIENGFGKALVTLPGLFLLTVLSIGLSFGLGGMVELIGERLAPAQTAFRRTLWGTLALSLGSAVPFVGWFLLLPYAGLVGLGAFIVGFVWKEPTQSA